MRALVVAPIVALAGAVACLRSVSYECESDAFCQHAGVQGTCEANRYCAYPDSACPSGKRFGTVGPLAGQCVDISIMPDGPVDTVSGFSIGGIASGTTASGLVLRDNASDSLAVPSNGPFTFMQRLGTGSAYDVIVTARPPAQLCALVNFAGTVGSADVTNIQANCVAGSGNGIACGGTVCSPVGTKSCCHGKTDASGSCGNLGALCAGTQSEERCDDSGDCGGLPAVCCARITSSGSIKQTILCVASTNNCTASGTDTAEYLCDPAAATPCPGTMKCVPDLTHGWHRCQ